MMSIRRVVSLILYHMGDYVCDVMFRRDIKMIWPYKLYGKLMLMSHQVDKHDEVWNKPEDVMLVSRYVHNKNEPVSEI